MTAKTSLPRAVTRQDPNSKFAKPGGLYLHLGPVVGLSHLFLATDPRDHTEATLTTRDGNYGNWHEGSDTHLCSEDGSMDAVTRGLIEVRLRAQLGVNQPTEEQLERVRERAEIIMKEITAWKG